MTARKPSDGAQMRALEMTHAHVQLVMSTYARDVTALTSKGALAL